MLRYFFINLLGPFVVLFLCISMANANEGVVQKVTLNDGKTIDIWWGRYDDGLIDTVFGRCITEHQSHSTEPFHLKTIRGKNRFGDWSIVENYDKSWNIKGRNLEGQVINLENIELKVKDYTPSELGQCKTKKDKLCTELQDLSKDQENKNTTCVLS